MGKTGFRYQRENEHDDGEEADGSTYSAQFPLTDDGVPNSERFLRVDVSTHAGGASEISATLVSCGKEYHLTTGEAKDLDAVANLLYGAARLVTTRTIQPK